MKIQAIRLVYFSPTKTTKVVLENIAEGIRSDIALSADFIPIAGGAFIGEHSFSTSLA